MDRRFNPASRDRAVRLVRRATIGGLVGAAGLTGIFSGAAVLTFSGKPVAVTLHPSPPPPPVPVAAAPVQAAPPTPIVVVQVVHHQAAAYSASGGSYASSTAPRPPGQLPVAVGLPALPPPPAPAPVCHSTPSVPC
jgi:hypothetical protein